MLDLCLILFCVIQESVCSHLHVEPNKPRIVLVWWIICGNPRQGVLLVEPSQFSITINFSELQLLQVLLYSFLSNREIGVLLYGIIQSWKHCLNTAYWSQSHFSGKIRRFSSELMSLTCFSKSPNFKTRNFFFFVGGGKLSYINISNLF